MPKHGVERDVRTGSLSPHETLRRGLMLAISAGTSGERMKALGSRLPEGLTVTRPICVCGHEKRLHGSRCRFRDKDGLQCSCGEYVKKQ